MDKRTLVSLMVADLHREIDVQARAALATREGATHEQSRPENDKDTRAIEASYLAGAQAERVADLRRAASALEALPLRAFTAKDRVAAAALVTVEIDGESRACFFVAQHGGGRRYEVDGRSIQAITPASPIASALLGRGVGDVVMVELARTKREYEIIDIE